MPLSRALSRLAASVLALQLSAVLAQAQARNPFGVGISEGGGSATGLTGWLLAQQGWFERELSQGVRGVTTDPHAVWWLAGVGLLYGVFHAAGPGHGKAVLASYMIANERALRRGIVLSLLAALLQGAVAIVLVGSLALLLHATAQRMKEVAAFVELISFAGVACLGAWLSWRKCKAFVALWRSCARPTMASNAQGPAAFGSVIAPFPQHGVPQFAFAGAATESSSRFTCVEAEAGVHSTTCLCHAPNPAVLRGERMLWREAGMTVLAAGARPCSGAILVLVFALVQGVFLAGIAAVAAMSIGVALTTGTLASVAVLAKGVAHRLARPGSRRGALLVSGLELAAAAAVLLVGASLLLGFAPVS